MNRKCLLSFQAPRGSLRNGHYCSLPLSLRHAHDLMPSCLHFHLVASFSGVRIDFSYLSQLPSQGHSCLPDSAWSLPPGDFAASLLPFAAFLCFSKLAGHSAVYLSDPNFPKDGAIFRSINHYSHSPAQGLQSMATSL